MNLDHKVVNDLLVLALREKRLDAGIAIQFKERVAEFVNQGHKAILLDMNAVDFIDSSGLGAIVSCLKILGLKGQISLCNLTAPVQAMFKLTRMEKVFPIYPTEEQALEALTK